MSFSYFVYFENSIQNETAIGEADRAALIDLLRRTPGLVKGHVYTPAPAKTPFSGDGAPPVLALQLYFATLPALEAAILEDGYLQQLASPLHWPGLGGRTVTHQAMFARSFLVAQSKSSSATERCSFLVHYPGPAQDLNAWLRHYMKHHTRLMAKFPGIRDIEVCTRVDWCDAMPWRRVDHMQRNRVMFDSPEALSAALASPILAEMRADSRSLPPFTGGSRHYPMRTTIFGLAA
jgi:uncharacterized protein (TIGR02118 family)